MKVSISRIKLFKACRRAFELKYIECLEPETVSDALQTGLSYHSKLEELYTNGSFDASDNSRESAMALAYQKYIYPHFKVKSVEDWFEYEINVEGDVLVGRTDGITEDGELVEHKTTGAVSLEEYEYGLQWDEQILAYMLATGTRKVWYTVVRKPTIRQRRGESDEDFFNRMCQWYDEDTDEKIRLFEITRTDEEVETFRKELEDIVSDMREAELFKDLHCNSFYRNTLHCNCWGRRCEYSPVCLHYDPDLEYVGFTKTERR